MKPLDNELAEILEQKAKEIDGYVEHTHYRNFSNVIFKTKDPVFSVPQWVHIKEIAKYEDYYVVVLNIFDGEMLYSRDVVKEHPLVRFDHSPFWNHDLAFDTDKLK